MSRSIQCPGCNKQYPLTPELAGKKVQCTGCGTTFEVPAAAGGPDGPSVQCPGCGKKYPLRPELAGKRVQCTGCGTAFDIPGAAPAEKPAPMKSAGVDDLFDEEFGTGVPAALPAGPRPGTSAHSPMSASLPPGAPGMGGGMLPPVRRKKPLLGEGNGKLLVFGIGAVVLVLGAVLAVYLVSSLVRSGGGPGPVASGDIEDVTERLIQVSNDLADALSGVRDADSARAVADRVDALTAEYADLMRQGARMADPLTKKEADRFKQKYESKVKDCSVRVGMEVGRVIRIPEAQAVLGTSLQRVLDVVGMKAPPSRPGMPGPSTPRVPGHRPGTRPHQPRVPTRPVEPEVTDPNDPEFYKQNLADLKGTDARRRRHAIRRLQEAEPKELRAEIVDALRQIAKGSDRFQAREAVKGLGHWGGAEVVPDLIAALKQQDDFARDAALEALAETKDPRAAEAIAALLGKRHFLEQHLQAMGPVAEDAVLARLDPPDQKRTPAACAVLGEIGTDKSLPKLKELSRNENFFIRVAAERAADRLVRRGVTSSGTSAGTEPAAPSAEPAAPSAEPDSMAQALLDLELSDNRARVAAEQLARMPVDPKRRAEVSAALVKLLSGTQEGSMKASALRALAVWQTSEALPEIVKCLDHESRLVQGGAYEALGTSQSEEAAKVCAARLDGKDRHGASRALRAMGPVAEDAVLACLGNPDRKVRAEACRVLGHIGTKKSLARLQPLATRGDVSVQLPATMAMQAIQDRGE